MHPNTSENQGLSHRIISWYQANPRDLPWRGIGDPYRIWLSEVILQQTRVAQGLPYYYAFVNAYPTVTDLAQAPEEEVLRLWQGLGYYSRARNLHACAKFIANELSGIFPSSYDELIKLKGVGSYTAAAIASFAFGEVKAVVDGNVFRVLARYFGIDTDIASSGGKKEFEKLANELIPADHPAEFNQAMMDFGARLCTPKNPDCSNCPVQTSCFAFKNNLQSELPVKINKTKVKERDLHYLVIRCGEKWVWRKRGHGDIWTGLHDFPELANSNPDLDFPIQKVPKDYRHILSHQRLSAQFSEMEIPEENYPELKDWCQSEGLLLVAEEEIEYLAKPKLIVNFLNDQGI
jgi:A/G-specific adenine glycosylase